MRNNSAQCSSWSRKIAVSAAFMAAVYGVANNHAASAQLAPHNPKKPKPKLSTEIIMDEGPIKIIDMNSSLRSEIKLKRKYDNGTFARYCLRDGDTREIIVRRGNEMGRSYGIETERKSRTVDGHPVTVTRIMGLLSPPPLSPTQKPIASNPRQYNPTYDLIKLNDAEILIPREPNGFSDSEVSTILSSITLK